MAIKFKVVELKPNFPKETGENKLYSGRFVQSGKISLNDLAKEISEKSSFASADVKGLVEMLAETASKHLNRGFGVDLGELGSFSLDLQSETTAKKKDFSARNIKRAKLRFTPSMQIKESLKEATFEPIE